MLFNKKYFLLNVDHVQTYVELICFWTLTLLEQLTIVLL